ncbi:hypothetical protein MKX03_010166, partial [Papaver bracteatum]
YLRRHTFGRDKPALNSISIISLKPPTPSILPFPSASGLSRPHEKTSVPSDKATPSAVGAPPYSSNTKCS